jgi:hypothetical protein
MRGPNDALFLLSDLFLSDRQRQIARLDREFPTTELSVSEGSSDPLSIDVGFKRPER